MPAIWHPYGRAFAFVIMQRSYLYVAGPHHLKQA